MSDWPKFELVRIGRTRRRLFMDGVELPKVKNVTVHEPPQGLTEVVVTFAAGSYDVRQVDAEEEI